MATERNLKINKLVKDRIDETMGEGTFDKKLNVLIETVTPIMPFVPYTNERQSIRTFDDTLEKIDSFRITTTESRDNILTRMLLAFDELNNTSSDTAEEWISFKLTNPYNNLLVISGQIEYNSRELSFNYRGNIYLDRLPSHYIVNGQDLSKELFLWYDNLDWNGITNNILQNVDVQIVIEEKDYILEVNNVI